MPKIHIFVVYRSTHLPAIPGLMSSNQTFILYVSSELQTHEPCIRRQMFSTLDHEGVWSWTKKKYLTKLIFFAQKTVHITVIRVRLIYLYFIFQTLLACVSVSFASAQLTGFQNNLDFNFNTEQQESTTPVPILRW